MSGVRWTCGHQALSDICEWLKVPFEKEALSSGVPVVEGNGARSTDMVEWLKGRGLEVEDRWVRMPEELDRLFIKGGGAAFVAVAVPGATRLHWVVVRRVVKVYWVEVADARKGITTIKKTEFLRSCRSQFWFVRRKSDDRRA